MNPPQVYMCFIKVIFQTLIIVVVKIDGDFPKGWLRLKGFMKEVNFKGIHFGIYFIFDVIHWRPTRYSLSSPSYLARNRTLGPPLGNNPEPPPSSRLEGLRLLYGLETNLSTSLQTPQVAWLPLVHPVSSKRYPSRLDSRAGFFASSRDECLSPRVCLECNPEIPVAPGEEHWLLDTSLDEVYWLCSHSRAIPSFPSQLEWKIGLPWANTRGILNSPS